jgi:hypothetical protein
MESAITPRSSQLPCPLKEATKDHIAAAVESLGSVYAAYAKALIEQGIDGPCLIDLLESPDPNVFNEFLEELGAKFIAHRTRLKTLFNSMHPGAAITPQSAMTPRAAIAPQTAITPRAAMSPRAAMTPRAAFMDPISPSDDHAHERALWLKACLILETCSKGVRPMVGRIMQRLHRRVIENVKQDIARDLGACDDEDWNCSTCTEADDIKFTENAPVALAVCAMDSNGIADCGAALDLKPYTLKPCRLRNIPSGYFPPSDNISPASPLLIFTNAPDIDKTGCSSFILLHALNPTPPHPHMPPFLVTRCDPSQPALCFPCVLCSSHPGHTAQLVKSFLSHQEPPHARCKLSFAFWSLASRGAEFTEFKHGLKKGHVLRFDGEANGLPSGIVQGRRYLVIDATDFSFNICPGPIVTPTASFSSEEAPLLVIRRSPIGR